MNTLLLDQTTWDLCLDVHGNIAMAQNPYALAQDTASAVRLFQGEAWYDTAQGIPYFDQILGQTPPLLLVKKLLETAALTVPELVGAKAYISGLVDRVLTGQIQVTDIDGGIQIVSISGNTNA